MSTEFDFIQIGTSDRKADTLRADWWRINNAVGRCSLLLRNTDGKFNGVFDVQDPITITITDRLGATRTMFRGRVSSAREIGMDGETPWDEYIVVNGWDIAQDLMFHNDFEKDYADVNTQIKTVLGDIFDIPKAIDTNITYNTPAGATPIVGSIGFKKGGNFLSTYQEAMRSVEWTSYVNDTGFLFAGSPGFSATGEIITNTGASKNIIGTVTLDEVDDNNLYNYVEITGKNPSFDIYTEQNASSWTSLPGTTLEDSTTNIMVGTYSQRCFNGLALTFLRHRLTAPIFNYTTWNMTKGEIAMWGYYDNQEGEGGAAPAAGTAANAIEITCRLIDANGLFVDYYGESSRLFIGDWGWITFPLGEGVNNSTISTRNQWSFPFGGDFDWENVVDIFIQAPRIAGDGFPSNFNIDGISFPFGGVAISEDAASQAAYRRRPIPLTMAHLNTQNLLDGRSAQLLAHSKDSGVGNLKLMVDGNIQLQYAAESVTVNIPDLNINNTIYYINEMHHAVSPREDVSEGYAFDYITELDLIAIGGVAYDNARLGEKPIYSGVQLSRNDGVGLTVK